MSGWRPQQSNKSQGATTVKETGNLKFRRQVDRPNTMTDKIRDDPNSDWVYAATGGRIPSDLNRPQQGWACIAGSLLFWKMRTTECFGDLMRNRRFWPTNLPKSLRVIPEKYHTCWHPPTMVAVGANSWGRWFPCTICGMRVNYQELKPGKGVTKEEKVCLCKKAQGACLICGQGWSQGGGDPQWQSIIPVPKVQNERQPWPLNPAMARPTPEPEQPYQRVAREAGDAVSHLEQDQRQMAAARRAASVKRGISSDSAPMDTSTDRLDTELKELQEKMERDLATGFQAKFDEMTNLIMNLAQNQQQQATDLRGVVSTQMQAIANIQAQVQETTRLAKEAGSPARDVASGSAAGSGASLGPSAAASMQSGSSAIGPPAAVDARAASGPKEFSISTPPKHTQTHSLVGPQPQIQGPPRAEKSQVDQPGPPQPTTWNYVGTGPLDPTQAPPAMASQAQLRAMAAAGAGAPSAAAPPLLGGYPTYGTTNPSVLYAAASQPVGGSTDSLETVSSYVIPSDKNLALQQKKQQGVAPYPPPLGYGRNHPRDRAGPAATAPVVPATPPIDSSAKQPQQPKKDAEHKPGATQEWEKTDDGWQQGWHTTGYQTYGNGKWT